MSLEIGSYYRPQVQRTWSCFSQTFRPMPIFSSMREYLPMILCRGTDSPGWIFLPPQIFRPLQQESLFWDSLIVSQWQKRELLAISSPTVQGWEGWKHSRWNPATKMLMFTSRLFSPLPLLLMESCMGTGGRTCANRASTSDNITPPASLLTSASQQVGEKSPK